MDSTVALITACSDAPGDPGDPGGQYPLQGDSVAGGYVGGGGVYTTLAATTHSTQAVTVNTFSIVHTVPKGWLLGSEMHWRLFIYAGLHSACTRG